MSPMDGDRDRYSAEAWEQTRQEALAARTADPPPRPAGSGHSPATLVPGIVRMSLRGDSSDVERFITAIEDADFKVWRGDSPGTMDGNQAGFRYFTVQVPGVRDG